MTSLTKEVQKICDDLDKNEQEFVQKKISKEDHKERKKRLENNLHRAVGKMREDFLNKINQIGFDKIPVADLISSAEVMGRYLSYEIKINKIRRFLDGLRRIEIKKEYDPQTVVLLRPQLAYTVGRSDKAEKEYIKNFQEFLDPVLKIISSNEDKALFEKGLRLMESIIAYHKYYGGED